MGTQLLSSKVMKLLSSGDSLNPDGAGFKALTLFANKVFLYKCAFYLQIAMPQSRFPVQDRNHCLPPFWIHRNANYLFEKRKHFTYYPHHLGGSNCWEIEVGNASPDSGACSSTKVNSRNPKKL